MPCSPRTARAQLDRYVDLARAADQRDFMHTLRLGGLSLTIDARVSATAPIFIRGADRIVCKRLVLQLIEVYGDESR